ncbi:MAG: hypothetical protein ACJAVI_003599 [Candidatus Azotimanducaceae bacterium]|jgi:hypothetical protein
MNLQCQISARYDTSLRLAGDTRYFYRRYMDDIIVLAKTRFALQAALWATKHEKSHLR